MTQPLADRLLELLADPLSRDVLRALLDEPETQGGLVDRIGASQSALSRAIKGLRAVGLVEADGLREALLTPAARDQTLGVLIAADRLAETLLDSEREAQRSASKRTRRAVVRPVTAEPLDVDDPRSPA